MAKGVLRWGGLLAAIVLAVFAYREWRNLHEPASEQDAIKRKNGALEAQGGAGGGQGSGRGGGRGQQGPVLVSIAKAQLGEMDRILEALGTVTPLSTVTVRSRVDGVLEKILFKEGQLVKTGEWLAQIDPVPLRLQVQQAEGVVQRDLAQLENAKADLARYKLLAEQDSGSKQQRDTQAAQVKQLEATLKIDQAQLANMRLQLSYTRIVAPVSGRIGLRQLDPGNVLKAGDAGSLAVITQTAPISVLFSIPQERLSLVLAAMQKNPNLAVRLYDRDAATPKAEGVLMAVDNQVDTATGTVRLRARFDNANGMLFPNQFANVGLLVEHLKDVVAIPVEGVQHGATGSFVYLLKPDQTVTVRNVTEGLAQGRRVMITQGLAAGDAIVVEGIDRLKEGAKVKVPSGRNGKHGSEAVSENGGDASSNHRAGHHGEHRKHDAQNTLQNVPQN